MEFESQNRIINHPGLDFPPDLNNLLHFSWSPGNELANSPAEKGGERAALLSKPSLDLESARPRFDLLVRSVDDLHFGGVLVREAKDELTSIARQEFADCSSNVPAGLCANRGRSGYAQRAQIRLPLGSALDWMLGMPPNKTCTSRPPIKVGQKARVGPRDMAHELCPTRPSS